MVESTDGRTVDAYTTDAVDADTTSGKKEGDLYSDMPEFRMFPFGKAVQADPGNRPVPSTCTLTCGTNTNRLNSHQHS